MTDTTKPYWIHEDADQDEKYHTPEEAMMAFLWCGRGSDDFLDRNYPESLTLEDLHESSYEIHKHITRTIRDEEELNKILSNIDHDDDSGEGLRVGGPYEEYLGCRTFTVTVTENITENKIEISFLAKPKE